jgi:hypothetical protein
MTRVAGQIVEPRQASLVAKGIHRLRGASGLESRGTHGIGGAQATASRVFCTEFQVQPELLFQVAVAPLWKQGPPETVNPFAKRVFIRHSNGITLRALERQMK